MPLYEYRCQSCGHHFELLVRSSTVPECPGCASQELEKLLSTFGISMGGGGKASELPPSCQGCPQPGAPGCGLN